MITIPNIATEKYAILGLGKSGLATAACLQTSKADIILWDDKQAARDEAAKAGYKLADPAEIDLTGYKALILAPGIPLTHPAPHPAVLRCRTAGVPVIGDIELLFRACPAATFVGITGTNGKSTTTALIAHILQSAGHKMQVGGNLGTAMLSLEPLGADGIYVLELSSFQLDLMQSNNFKVAVLLNITPDHIDRHGDMAGYIAAKTRIISSKAPQTLVIGSDEPETRAILANALRQPHLRVQEISVEHAITQGVMLAGQQIFAFEGEENGMPITNLPALKTLPGKHNAQNACAAFAACRALGLNKAEIVAGLKSFPGLAHRQQLIAEIDGVKFINDSKATNADATSKALATYNNIYWIIGGKAKDGGLNGLEGLLKQVRHAFIIGAATEQFSTWCEGKIPYTNSGVLEKAVQQAAAMARHDKSTQAVVLLSPACASYDQFANFEERGEKFGTYVKRLQQGEAA